MQERETGGGDACDGEGAVDADEGGQVDGSEERCGHEIVVVNGKGTVDKGELWEMQCAKCVQTIVGLTGEREVADGGE